MLVHRCSGRRSRSAVSVLVSCVLVIALGGCGSGGAVERDRPATNAGSTTSTIALPGPDDTRYVALNDEQRRAAAHAALTDPRLAALLDGLDPRPADVLPWSRDGTMATLFGSAMTLEWDQPVELETDWPLADDNDDGTVELATQHYRATDVTRLYVLVVFDPLRVVSFEPEGNVEPATVGTLHLVGTMTTD